MTSTPSWRRSCAASGRAIRNDVVSSARSRWCVSRGQARTASGEEPRVEHDRGRVGVGTSSPTQRGFARDGSVLSAGDTAPLPRGCANATVDRRDRDEGRSPRTPHVPRTTVGSPAPWTRDVPSGTRARLRLAGGPLADRAHPAVRERDRSPVHLSRPGHLLPPGVRHRRASWAGPGLGPPVRTPGPAFGSGTSMRRGRPALRRAVLGRAGSERAGPGRSGGAPRNQRSSPRARVPRRACAEGAEGAEDALLLGRVPRGVLAGDRCRTGERGDPDGRASVTCAGADDPKPQCRLGRLMACPACVGWGDTSPTDDPIRKRHQDL